MERLKQIFFYYRVILIFSLFSFPVHAAVYDVTVLTDTAPASGFTNNVPGELRTALSDAAVNPGPHTIRFALPAGGTIILNRALPAITRDLTIDHTTLYPATTLAIDGAATYPIFFVYGRETDAAAITVNILGGQSFTLQNGLAQGGSGGGGGMGAGGALFVNAGMTVNLSNMNFDSNQAIEGNAVASKGHGGGGSVGGNGGLGDQDDGSAGGGGALLVLVGKQVILQMAQRA